MAPPRPPKLDAASLKDNSSNTPKKSHPDSFVLVTSGATNRETINKETLEWKENGFANGITLRGLVYELSPGEDVTTANVFQAGHDARHNLPISVVHPLKGSILPNLPVRATSGSAETAAPDLPDLASPFHQQINFALPTLRSITELEDRERWITLIKDAEEKAYSVELALGANTDGVTSGLQEGLEEILSKSIPGDGEEGKGGFVVFDGWAAPPVHLASSQLMRSEELSNWSGFISRLALHPHTYIKLSPLTFGSSFGTTRTADHSSSLLQSATETLSSAAATVEASMTNAVKPLAVPSVATKEGSESETSQKEGDENKRRVRVFLEVIIEAFGTDRVVFASGKSSSKEEVEEWYDAVREGLVGMGLEGEDLQKVFSDNASKVYRV